jgi:hypothetical protein
MIQDHIFEKHGTHEVVIDENPISRKGKPVLNQIACLRCVTCNKWLKWLSGKELVALGRITDAEWQEWQQLQRSRNTECDYSPWL